MSNGNVYPDAVKVKSRKLIAAGRPMAEVCAIVQAPKGTIYFWVHGRKPRKPRAIVECCFPVRLRVEPGFEGSRIALRRGCKLLAVLGIFRFGKWDLSPAGEAKKRSLNAVLPTILRRFERKTA